MQFVSSHTTIVVHMA